MSGNLLEIKDLVVKYYTLSGIVRAVDHVSLSIRPGEWLSVVGESGCGKSTMAYSIVRLISPPGRIVGGQILFNGRDLLSMKPKEFRKILGREIGVVFQDPMTSLDPLRRIGDQIAEVYITHLGMKKKEALEKAGEVLERVGIPRDKINAYPHQMSGGQRQRVAIAIAVALKPKLLIADEPTTALDVIVQDTIMDLLESFKEEGTSILFITHDLALAAERSDRIAVMYAGKLVEEGPVEEIVENTLHPYTQGLLRSVPDLWGPKKIESIPGYPPDLRSPPPGCRFHPRCKIADDTCRRQEPVLNCVGEHCIACHKAGELLKR
ncbi:MAG: ABC transporter ATP-binding protein [Crenarchaeota archaeon]|nr:ABC transporter ATP-binding protein [Thermoproteota archaeon]